MFLRESVAVIIGGKDVSSAKVRNMHRERRSEGLTKDLCSVATCNAIVSVLIPLPDCYAIDIIDRAVSQ